LEIVGDVPALLIIEGAFLGVSRFDGFLKRTGIPKDLLSGRLKRLVAAECMRKVPYSTAPVRYEYQLTDKGLDLYETALLMLRWETKWSTGRGKIQVVLTHTECGEVVSPIPVCRACHSIIDARDVSWQDGPGVGRVKAEYGRRRRQSVAARARQDVTTLFDTVIRIVGNRWSALIIRSLFMGINTFDEILADTGMATNILADRLREMSDAGVLTNCQYPGYPQRTGYRLTDKGLDLYPILVAMLKWGDRWYEAPEGPPLILLHKSCGEPLEQQVVCSECELPLSVGTVQFELIEVSET